MSTEVGPRHLMRPVTLCLPGRELETQLKSLETDHRQLKQEAAALRRQNASLDEEYHGKSKSGEGPPQQRYGIGLWNADN